MTDAPHTHSSKAELASSCDAPPWSDPLAHSPKRWPNKWRYFRSRPNPSLPGGHAGGARRPRSIEGVEQWELTDRLLNSCDAASASVSLDQ